MAPPEEEQVPSAPASEPILDQPSGGSAEQPASNAEQEEARMHSWDTYKYYIYIGPGVGPIGLPRVVLKKII